MQNSATTATRRLVVGGSMAAILASVVAVVLIPAAVRSMMSSAFLPHVYCYLYNKNLIALHVGSDGIIWLSYVSIALTLAYLVRRTREIPFSWMFLAFGTFIIACGFTHFMEMVVLWKPLYWLAGDVKLVTALASVVTAIALPPLVPQIQEMIKSASVSEQRRVQLENANEELQHLSARVMSAQDGERRRIARDLHDGVGQYMAAIKMSIDMALVKKQDPEITRRALIDSQSLLEQCTTEIRTMSYLLHPPLLEDVGFVSAARWFVDGFMERSGISADLQMPESLPRLPDAMEIALFRVLQESLTNVHRHSGSTRADISLSVDGRNVVLQIADQGKGFGGLPHDPTKMGVGVMGMRERIREMGGEFKIDSTSHGTTVQATLPLQLKRPSQ